MTAPTIDVVNKWELLCRGGGSSPSRSETTSALCSSIASRGLTGPHSAAARRLVSFFEANASKTKSAQSGGGLGAKGAYAHGTGREADAPDDVVG